MGRAPCCDKANVKRGPWSPEEDAKLKSYIEEHGTGGNWIALPKKIGLKRCGKSCRLRWLNYLRPNIKHGGFSEEEDNLICSLYISIGSRWSIIAAQLPGRTDNDIKNYWNTRLKKKLLGKQRKDQQARRDHSNKNQQEMNKKVRAKENSMATFDNYNNVVINPNPYRPNLPVLPPIPYSNQEPRFNDHACTRQLLIKLGGKFSDDDNGQTLNQGLTNLQFPTNIISSVQPNFEQSINILPPADQMDVLNTGVSPLPNSTFPDELIEEMLCSNPQRFDGLEFLYGDMRIGTSSSSCEDWGEMSTLVYPPVVSNYEGKYGLQQEGTLRKAGLEELRYPGPEGNNGIVH